MSMLDIGKVCVFSEFKIKLLKDGEPIKDARVVREWEWNDTKSKDEKMTDESGVVAFPAVFKRSVSKLLPIEIVIDQVLSVEIEGELVEFWSGAKRKAEENSEYHGKTINLICDLGDEELVERDFTQIIISKCKWRETL